jgi:hypothetical protein
MDDRHRRALIRECHPASSPTAALVAAVERAAKEARAGSQEGRSGGEGIETAPSPSARERVGGEGGACVHA